MNNEIQFTCIAQDFMKYKRASGSKVCISRTIIAV